MTNRWRALLLLIGVVGYGSLIFFFTRLDNATKWYYQLDRDQALLKAQTVAQSQGVDVTGWMTSILTARDRNREQYLQEHNATDFETDLLSPLKTTVNFRDPRENRTVEVILSARGQLLKFERTGVKVSNTDTNALLDKARTEQRVIELLGEVHSRFAFAAESEPEKGRRQFGWRHVSSNEPELKFDLEAAVTGSVLTRVEIKESLPNAYREELSRRDLASFALVGGLEFIFTMLSVIGGLVLYFLYLNRKELDHLSSLLFFALTFLLFLIGFGLTALLNEYKAGRFGIQGINHATMLVVLPYVMYGLTSLFLALLLTVFWATGEATHAKYRTGRLTVWAAALRGQVFNQTVANNICAGLLVGGAITVLPYVLAWVSGYPVTASEFTSLHDLFTTSIPVLAGFFSSVISGQMFFLVLLFAFLVPVLRAHLNPQWLAQGLFVLVGIIGLLDVSPNQTASLVGKLVVASVWLMIFCGLYFYFDFLAVLTANFAAGFALKMMGLYVQPALSLQTAGKQGLIVLGLVILLALVLTRLAPDTRLEPRQLLSAHEDQAQRERLKAEFSVARKAQENLLPASAPQIPGFSIAALCRPARECGGDLYDFIELRDGKLGIVVADVSGKGVPAALYMTLTKGLLLSVSENTSDPGEILREVNKHLYEVCKRKTFVTLFLGVLDPHTKTLIYARAGHNPPLWRRQSEQTTQWLKSAGIGLGLNAGKSFDRVLKVEQLQLSPNDMLIFYSDGISEAMNEHQEEYGEERLERVAAITDGMGAEETLSAVFANVSNFLGKELPQDDQTLVVVRVT